MLIVYLLLSLVIELNLLFWWLGWTDAAMVLDGTVTGAVLWIVASGRRGRGQPGRTLPAPVIAETTGEDRAA